MRSRTIFASSCFSLAVLAVTAAGCTGGGNPPPTTVPTPPTTSPGGGGGSHQKGPNPTASSVGATNGGFATATINISGQSGFAGGKIYYPTDTSQGTYGAIVLAPPYLVNSTATDPMAQRISSHGFVVLNFDANSTSDFPSARATQAKAAIQYLLSSSVANRIDSSRLAIGGYSMGGGATLEVARDTPSLKAAVAMVPWNTVTNFSGIRVPTAILGGDADTVAPPAQHGQVFYNSIPASTPKLIAEVSGGSHFVPSTPPASFTQYAVAWLKIFVDGDTRYTPYVQTKASDISTFMKSGV
jgi:predicted dienelactone hydrolase